jgi:zinc/manganese transport system substrate-binding protein
MWFVSTLRGNHYAHAFVIKTYGQQLVRLFECFGPHAAAAFFALGFLCSTEPVDASTRLRVVGAENFYADVIAQIGGPYVKVVSVLSNPNTDPHSYESSTVDASAVAAADLVVQNGVGYDDFMQKLEAASPSDKRKVIDVGLLAGRKKGDNPHLWFDPATMPKVAMRIEAELERRDPMHHADYRMNLRTFIRSLDAWKSTIVSLRRQYARVAVVVTEPVFNYTLSAAGIDVRTPPSFQLAIEEGNDPAPQDVTAVRQLISGGSVKAFIYNQQTVEPSTVKLLSLARASHVPVVGVYETMPAGKTYQRWMLAETQALRMALAQGISTETIR